VFAQSSIHPVLSRWLLLKIALRLGLGHCQPVATMQSMSLLKILHSSCHLSVVLLVISTLH